MKAVVVLDTTVVVAGIGWRGEARPVLRLLARRGFVSVRTPYLAAEWTETLSRLSAEKDWPNPNWVGWLSWLKRVSVLVEEPIVRPTVRRDPKDDPILAAATAARASYLVTFDRDLLDLEKPYGVACIRPRAFLRAILAGH